MPKLLGADDGKNVRHGLVTLVVVVIDDIIVFVEDLGFLTGAGKTQKDLVLGLGSS